MLAKVIDNGNIAQVQLTGLEDADKKIQLLIGQVNIFWVRYQYDYFPLVFTQVLQDRCSCFRPGERLMAPVAGLSIK